MKYTLLFFFLSTAVLATPLDFDVKPLGYKSCASIPSDMGWKTKPGWCNGTPSITYMIEGQNLIDIKKDSLSINSMTLNDKDLTLNSAGNKSYKLFPIVRVSDDGKYAVFTLSLDKTLFKRIEQVTFDGQISVMTSSQSEEKILQKVNPADRKEYDIEGFKVTVKPQDGFMSIRVEGAVESLHSIDVLDGNNILKSQGYSYQDNWVERNYEQPKHLEIGLKIKYWKDLSTREVKFSW